MNKCNHVTLFESQSWFFSLAQCGLCGHYLLKPLRKPKDGDGELSLLFHDRKAANNKLPLRRSDGEQLRLVDVEIGRWVVFDPVTGLTDVERARMGRSGA